MIPLAVALGDFNGDGKLDLVSRMKDGTVSVWLGRGDGTFAHLGTYAVGTFPSA